MLYESALVGAFNYMWGYRDAIAGKPASMTMLSNAQNPLDHLLGDLIGKVEGRYFLIEFKTAEDGFFDEVHGKSIKLARANLYGHLRTDFECRKLARFGHFGAWSNGALQFAPYAHAVGRGGYPSTPNHELNHASFKADFEKFYAEINCSDLTPFGQDAALYANGLGLPANAMFDYVECILQHFPDVVDASEEAKAIFGFWSPVTASVVAVPTTIEGLLQSFEEVKRLTQKQVHISTRSGHHP